MSPQIPGAPGAFRRVRLLWLPLWAIVGAAVVMVGGEALSAATGTTVSEDLMGVLLYVPIVLWVLLVVVQRNGVDLSVMLRWPRLGTYWWAVAGLFVVQLLFSLGAITLTQLVFPDLADALEGVGEGNLLWATLGLVVLPPLVEEIVFRGVIIERLAILWRVRAAILVSAVAFGILHVDPIGAGMFGVMTGLLYLRTGSLWPGILIHFANNLIALAATRTSSGPEVEPTLSESLTTAGTALALSVPFLAWFIIRNWPARQAATPYQVHEGGGVPDATTVTFPDVVWSAAALPVRLTVTDSQLAVDRPDPSDPSGVAGTLIAVLPVEQVAAAYPADVPGGQHVVILLDDGSWTTMRVGVGAPAPTAELARAISERAAARRRLPA